MKMKRFLFPLLLASFLFGAFFPVVSSAGGDRTVTILYSGSVKGAVAPFQI
jgi:hypothetical protein